MVDRDTRPSRDDDGSSLSRNAKVKGRISGTGNLVVEGSIEGEVLIDGDLSIAKGAEVKAKVEANTAVIEGLLEGDLVVSGSVKATSQAVVQGTISADSFSMEEGAQVTATVETEFDLPPELRAPSR